jgi:hypothetical protein
MLLRVNYSMVIYFHMPFASSNDCSAKCAAFEPDLTISCLKPKEGRTTLAHGQARIDIQAVVLNVFRFIGKPRRGLYILW